MKLLIVGSNDITAIENHYVNHLREVGVCVHHFTAESIFNEYYNTSYVTKLLFKSGLSQIYNKINRLFIDEVDGFRPDIVWIFKGMQIYPKSLLGIKQQKIKLVNYNPDNPFIFSGKGSGNKNVTDSIGLYDLHFTYHQGVKKKLEKDFRAKVSILPFGFDDDEVLYKECAAQDEIFKLCFLGNPDKKRVEFIKALSSKGIGIDLFGNGWSRYLNGGNISVFKPAYGVELWKVLRRYRAQLNLMRIHNDDSHNMRTFEVPGIGGIMIAPNTKEHRLYFEDGREIFLYKGVDDCADLVKNLLEMPKESADKIRLAARNRSVLSGYSYKQRAMQALSNLNELISHQRISDTGQSR